MFSHYCKNSNTHPEDTSLPVDVVPVALPLPHLHSCLQQL